MHVHVLTFASTTSTTTLLTYALTLTAAVAVTLAQGLTVRPHASLGRNLGPAIGLALTPHMVMLSLGLTVAGGRPPQLILHHRPSHRPPLLTVSVAAPPCLLALVQRYL